jgi:beta-glucanase (GH16 family)
MIWMKSKLTAIACIMLLVTIVVVGLLYGPGGAKSDTVRSVSSKKVSPTPASSATTPPNVTNSNQWVTAFSDDFNGTQLDTSKWSTCYDWRPAATNGCTNGGNNEQEWYLPQQVSLKNGSANLTATNQPITVNTQHGQKTYPYRSGMISTGRADTNSKVKWASKYGYFIARMKVNGGQGVWPAFWLLPANRVWPPEIDIMELLGSKPNNVLLTMHWQGANGPATNSSTITGPDYTQGWHTYAVYWQPGIVNWYVDGTLKKSISGTNVPATPMEIIVDLAVGGTLPGNADSSTSFPRTAQIDYVKAYELKQ